MTSRQASSEMSTAGALDALPVISATDFKRDFANVFRNLGPRGVLAVANHRHTQAVLIGIDEYAELVSLRETLLGSLEAEFDRAFAAMQTPRAAAAAELLFSASPAELGAAALTAASPPDRNSHG